MVTAQQFLGVAVTVPFETAVLETVRTGFPQILSACIVILELFERIGFLLYSQAFIDDPRRADFAFDLPRLDASLECWSSDSWCATARRDVNTLAKSGAGQFLDPIDYLHYIQQFVPCVETRADGSKATHEPAATPLRLDVPGLPPVPAVVDLIPRMLAAAPTATCTAAISSLVWCAIA